MASHSPDLSPLASVAEVAPTSIAEEARILGEQLHRNRRMNVIIGVGMCAVGAVTTMAQRVSTEGASLFHLPFSEPAMNALNNVDNVLEAAGAVGLTASLFAVGALKIAAARNPQLEAIDKTTSADLSPGGSARPHRWLRRLAAGRLPVIASLAAGLTMLSGAIDQEITKGPTDSITAVAENFPGGQDTRLIVQDATALPMTQSTVTGVLTGAIINEASERGIDAMPFVENLGAVTSNDEVLTSITYGMPTPADSPLNWEASDGCEVIPVMVDSKSGLELGQDDVRLQGVPVEIVGEVSGMSAINRVGIAADLNAIQQCIEKGNPNFYGVALDASVQEAQEILVKANANIGEVAAAISLDDYKQNSEDFWEKNVKPLTNIFALIASTLAFVSIANDISMRILRSRPQLANILATGISHNQIRLMETARALKEVPLATLLGFGGSVIASSAISAVVFGTQAAVGIREGLAGAGAVFLSSLGALFAKVGTKAKIYKSVGLEMSER